MNKKAIDVFRIILTENNISQRELAGKLRCSLGCVNNCIKELKKIGWLDENQNINKGAVSNAKSTSPQRAIILAAGFGMRMVPINTEETKGLLEINGEPLIERLINQLHEVGIFEIYIVVGFLKERYEYLIDKFGVDLIVNSKYATTNNIHSVNCAKKYIDNAYIIPCDLWFKHNPFNRYEFYSWYMVSDELDEKSNLTINRSGELIKISDIQLGNRMIGVGYITQDAKTKIINKIQEMCSNKLYDNAFWEQALYEHNKMFVYSNNISSEEVVEINTYEQLRELDSQSKNLKTDALYIIMQVFNVSIDEVKNISVLKKGMTNRSFLFECNDKKYIMRIPGEGTSNLINRSQEYEVYKVLKDSGISDNVLYLNPVNGYKITEFLNDARVCDPLNFSDVGKCMKKLKEFHSLKLKVEHEFDIFEQLYKYERLRGERSIYKDYDQTKQKVMKLKSFVQSHIEKKVLTHIDSVPDNFLFVNLEDREQIKLIDWEYAGMQDPHIDIAMFCIYAMYDEKQIDKVIDLYFDSHCDSTTRCKIYGYIAICGLLWSNWCEYKRSLGVDFGEYSLAQYRFAKVYSEKTLKLIGGIQ